MRELPGDTTAMATLNVGILGAGAAGLSTAIRLLTDPALSNAKVTVIAEKTGDETTSRGAGGLWKPYSLANTPEEDIMKWGKETFDYWLQLFSSAEAAAAGMQLVDTFQLWDEPTPEPAWKDIVPNFRHLTQKELDMFKEQKPHSGWKWTTLICDSQVFMRYLNKQFQQAGGVLDRRKIQDLSELADYDVVVNCLGLGAKALFKDDKMVPVRGQVVRVRAPWVKHCYFMNEQNYIIPNLDTVVLGGTRDQGSWETTISQEDKRRIIEGCSKMVPSLKDAEVVADWAGLRPYRDRVLVALDQKEVTGKDGTTRQLPIVHNYGHGGAGLTLHWGCAGDAAGLVRQCLQTRSSRRPASKL